MLFARSHDPLARKEKLTITCTTSMITDAVRQIAGSHATVIGLMGPGVDPHLYRAKAGDAYTIAQADIIFYNGLHLEGKMIDMFGKLNRHKPCIALGDLLDAAVLLPSEHPNVYDPHIWHDVQLWKQIVSFICATLQQYDPDHATDYQAAAQTYYTQLDELDAHITTAVAQLEPSERILVTAHDAFSYFGKAYNFRIVGLQGISTEAEINTKDIENVVACIIEHHVRAIFVESSIAPGSMQALKEAVQARGWDIASGNELFSDALGDATTGADTYISMMRYNCSALVAALQQK